jgi:competence protein ComGC
VSPTPETTDRPTPETLEKEQGKQRSLSKTLLCMLIVMGVMSVLLATGLVLAVKSLGDQKVRSDNLGSRTIQQQVEIDALREQVNGLQLQITQMRP